MPLPATGKGDNISKKGVANLCQESCDQENSLFGGREEWWWRWCQEQSSCEDGREL